MKFKKYKLDKIKNIKLVKKLSSESENEFLDKTAAAISNNDAVLVGGDFSSDKEFVNICKKIRELSSLFNKAFFVKNRTDIMQITAADGVIFDENGIEPDDAKMIIEDEKILLGIQIKTSAEINDYKAENYDFAITVDENIIINPKLA